MNHENNFNPDFKEDIHAKELAEIMCIKSMEQNIESLGNNEVYRIIEENFSNAKSRLRYRKYFLLANGIIPESEVKNV